MGVDSRQGGGDEALDEASGAEASALPRMLSAIVKESQGKQAKIKARNDRNRKEAMAATESVVNLMTDNVRERVNEVFASQNKLEKEVRGLQTNTAHFAKQTYQWLEMVKSFNGSLKVLCVRACKHRLDLVRPPHAMFARGVCASSQRSTNSQSSDPP